MSHKKLPDINLRNHYAIAAAIKTMGEHAHSMLEDAIVSYETNDVNLVDAVKSKNAMVNTINKELLKALLNHPAADSRSQEAVLELHTAIRYIERVADRATNVAEAVFYMVTGIPI